MSMEEIRELIENKQYTLLRQELAELQEADAAAVLEELAKPPPHPHAPLGRPGYGMVGHDGGKVDAPGPPKDEPRQNRENRGKGEEPSRLGL